MRVGVGVLAVALVFPAAASAHNTPGGPATLMNQRTGASTAEGRPPEVLVAAGVTVGAGGQAGTIRIRAREAAVTKVGDPVTLPAEPGTYTFAAPHIRWDYRSGQLGFDQETGDHAVLSQDPCDPSLGRGADPCQIQRVDVWTPPGAEGDPQQVREGARLAINGVFEPDLDQDLVGDTTEDRTDLRISATPRRDADGRLRIAVTITNAGPRAADLPQIETPLAGAAIEGCRPFGPSSSEFWLMFKQCVQTAALAPGESRAFAITAGAKPDAVATTVKILGEGPDLNDADNTATVNFAAEPAFTVATGKSQTLKRGVTVRVRGVRAGRARVTVAFRVHGRTLKLGKVVALEPYAERAVTLRANGAKLRSLRRALARGAMKAEITVRTMSGKTPVTTTTKVTR